VQGLLVERRLHKSRMTSGTTYRADKPSGLYAKARPRRRRGNYPAKRIKNTKRLQVLKKAEQTGVLLIAPETGRLPEEMGSLARYISGKAGGLGEVVSALCEGLRARGINCHLATLNLKARFREESGMDENVWRQVRYHVDPDRIHLVSSSIYANLPSPYAGDPLLNAAEFQKELVNNVIKSVRARCGGRLIIHSHDWMAGGAVTAYAKSRDCPVLHTVHNVHTGHIPIDSLFGVDISSLNWNIYFSHENGRPCIDSQATAIKSATMVNFVGGKFLREIIEDYFHDRSFIPTSVRQEVKAKHDNGAAFAIINAPSPRMYPEHYEHLVRRYGPDDDVLAAKRENLVAFQRRTGLIVNPDAILLFWPSRLDETQKGCELLEHIALKFVIENGDVEIAVVGNGVDGDRSHEEIMGRIAWASRGKIAYRRFSEPLSMLGYAAAADVFGASLYEPCGQIDQIGNLFGATATNRDTGGYHDKIKDLVAAHDEGNGFLFCHYDPGGLWHGLSRSVAFHRKPPEIREKQIKRIMREARERYSLDGMVDQYLNAYEKLNGGPLY